MPSFIPRHEPVKKKEEFELKKQILVDAILNNLEMEILTKKAEKYKESKKLFLKATLHIIRDKEFSKKKHNYNKEKLEQELINLNEKSIVEIIEEIKNENQFNFKR